MNPFATIITVCYNSSATIERTILSVLNQTCNFFEYIIIDGKSTDGTLDIIKKYDEIFKNKGISFTWISEPDKGIYDAMNKGIKLATGDFLFFLNANDVFYNEYVLENVTRVLEENKEIKFLFGNIRIVKDKKDYYFPTYERITNVFSLIINNICHQSIFYHKSLFELFGYYSKDYKICGDWDFNIKCLVKNKVSAGYFPIVITKFLWGGLCSRKDTEKQIKNEKRMLTKTYYPKSGFIFLAHDFFKDNFRSLYCRGIKYLLIKKVAIKIINLPQYKLNIKCLDKPLVK
jgi:glycosyltransferase involved in cell wall biosynthesis